MSEEPRPITGRTPPEPSIEDSPAYTAAVGLAGLACMILGAEAFKSSVAKLKRSGHSLGQFIRHAERLGQLAGNPEHELEEREHGGSNGA